MQKVFEKMEELELSGLYNSNQLDVIKYAMMRDGIDENLFMNPAIPSEYMTVYLQLKTTKKTIPLEKYMNGNWHSLGYTPDQLYSVIWGDSVGVDISHFSPDMTKEEIKNAVNQQLDNKKVDNLIQTSTMPFNKLEQIQQLGFSNEVQSFLLRVGEKSDIGVFLQPQFTHFSLEQIQYLYSILSIGCSIDRIMDPNLSVEQMKTIMSYSPESLQFISEIQENVNNRKNKQ